MYHREWSAIVWFGQKIVIATVYCDCTTTKNTTASKQDAMARVRKFTTMNIFSLDAKKFSKANATNGNDFCVDMANDITILYVMALNLCNFEHSDSLDIANTLGDRRIAGVLIALAFISWIISIFIGTDADPLGVICVNALVIIFAFPVLMNMNFTLLYFKRKSFVLYWKVYNIATLYIAMFYLRAQFEIDEFNKEKWQMHESIIFSMIITFTGLAITFVISLHQGFVISKINQSWKIGVTALMIGYIGFVGVRAYLQENMEHDAQIAGVKFSVRNMIISKAFDMVLWFSYQLYQLVRRPNTLYLTSKIQINWI